MDRPWCQACLIHSKSPTDIYGIRDPPGRVQLIRSYPVLDHCLEVLERKTAEGQGSPSKSASGGPWGATGCGPEGPEKPHAGGLLLPQRGWLLPWEGVFGESNTQPHPTFRCKGSPQPSGLQPHRRKETQKEGARLTPWGAGKAIAHSPAARRARGPRTELVPASVLGQMATWRKFVSLPEQEFSENRFSLIDNAR